MGTGTVAATVGTGATVAASVGGAAGAGAAAGGIVAGSTAAVAGASGAACATATGLGAGAGSAAATAVTSTSAGGAALTAGIAAGPLGWICLGATAADENSYSYDCWKPVLHDESAEPSTGMLIKDVLAHPHVKEVHDAGRAVLDGLYPEIIIQNVWDERFLIQYVKLSNNVLAAHALRMD